MDDPSLPPELWVRVLRLLREGSADIASCRLVCKSWCTVATEFLIPTVVISKQSDSLLRLNNILNHPVFSRYVKELLYDGSRYDEFIAQDYNRYVSILEKFPSRTYLLCRPEEQPEDVVNFARETRQSDDLSELSGLDGATESSPLSLRPSFREYQKRFLNQAIIISQRSELTALKNALRKLPRLRKLTYSDFRYRAKPNEPYLDLCKRLFGRVVEPQALALWEEDAMLEFLSVVGVVNRTPEARIRSLSIGDHIYNYPEMEEGRPFIERTYIHVPWSHTALPHRFLDDDDDNDDMLAGSLAGSDEDMLDWSEGASIESDVDDVEAEMGTNVDANTDMDSDTTTDVESVQNGELATWLNSEIAFRALETLHLPVQIPLQDAFEDLFVAERELPSSNLRSFLQHNLSTLVNGTLCFGVYQNQGISGL